jgi:hypothetical protein
VSVRVFEVSPTLQIAGAYVAGDAVGGLLTFANVCSAFEPSARIVGALLIDDAAQAAVLDLMLFDRSFTPTADADEWDPSDADLENCIGAVHFAATDYIAAKDSSVAYLVLDRPIVLNDGETDLFAQLKVEGTPTYIAAGDLTIKLFIEV